MNTETINGPDPRLLEGHPEYPPVTVAQLVAKLLTLPQDREIVLYPKYHNPIGKFSVSRFYVDNCLEAEDGPYRYCTIRF